MSPATHPPDGRLDGDKRPEHRAAQLAPKPGVNPPFAISSEALLRGQPSVTIAHQGALYRLQTTRQGKLILTK
jgi:hemin uptake protein HemP